MIETAISLSIILPIMAISSLLYKKYDKKISYNNDTYYGLRLLNLGIQNTILLFGIIVYPLIKKILKDSIKCKYYIILLNDDTYEYLTPIDLIKKTKIADRNLKLIKLKYNRKNFVKRNLFNIFVNV